MTQISFFLSSLRGGGAERVMVTLANEMATRGYEVDLLPASVEGVYVNDIADAVSLVELQTVDMLPSETLPALPALTHYLGEKEPTTLLSTMDGPNVVALWANALAGSDTDAVIRLSNTIRTRSEHLKGRLLDRFVKKWYPTADEVVTVSSDIQTDAESLLDVPSEKTTVIHNPIDLERIDEQKLIPVSDSWFNDDVPLVLGVGRLDEQKQFSTLIEAVAHLQSQQPCRLVLLGDGPRRDRLLALVDSKGVSDVVKLLGFVKNPYAYMAKADIFALSSAWEGCPNVLLEALACGTTPVATDCPGASADILDSGEYGFLTPVGDAKKMAAAISSALTSSVPDTKLWRRARHFSIKRVADRYERVLLE